MGYFYILFSQKLNRYYCGSCTDIVRRLNQHNAAGSTYTKAGLPWVLVHKEKFESLSEARKRESAVKKKKSRKYIESLIASSTP
jgi:putative endonuclease